jgi:hypothetical protein
VTLNITPDAVNWDATQLLMVFMGIAVDTGFDENEFLDVEPEAELFGHKVGADGEVTRFRNNNRVVKITLKLMQTSIANTLMSALANLDQNTPGGAGIGPMLIQDLQGTSLFAAEFCWISKMPKRTFAREVQVREWEMTAIISTEVDGND